MGVVEIKIPPDGGKYIHDQGVHLCISAAAAARNDKVLKLLFTIHLIDSRFETIQKLQGSQAIGYSPTGVRGLRPYRNYKVLKRR